MIETTKLTKAFDRLEALNNVSIHVNKGSIYGLVGSNGAGKTTLLKILAGVYRQDAGAVQIDGCPVFEKLEVKGRVVFLPDHPQFLPQYSVNRMAQLYARVYPAWSEQRFEKLSQVFQIDRKKRINSLSKGMQRQVAFWLALSCMPDVMLLDEPFDGLDPVIRQTIRNLIVQEVADRETTVVISSHNLKELEDLCDSIAVLHQGKLMMERELDDMKSDVYKIQAAFGKEFDSTKISEARVLFEESRGSIQLLIVKGAREKLIEQLKVFEPVLLDMLPLTLEELFIYEMGDAGYEIKNIIL